MNPASVPPPASAPSVLKRYEIVGLLATGGMAEVYLARAKSLGGFEKLFVIKRIRPELAQNKDFARMILDEARIAATLQHSNIVQVFDVDTDEGTVFLVMEYLHGHDVREIAHRAREGGAGKVPLNHGVNIALGLCAGLHYAHEKADDQGRSLGIVHRDVSPHNVLVTFDGAVKLIDFGIAKASIKLSKTLLGMVRGKPGYMSPEQCAGDRLDRRSDVFCIAILLYELATGTSPYDATDAQALFNAVLDSDPVPPSTRLPTFPEELERIVMRGLARDRTRRYATALEMRRDLEAFAHDARLVVSPFALAEYMDQLFSEETTTLREAAERTGGEIGEYVMAFRTAGLRAVALDPDAPTPLWRGSGDASSMPPPSRDGREGDERSSQDRAELLPAPVRSRNEGAASTPLGPQPMSGFDGTRDEPRTTSSAPPPAPQRRSRLALAAGLVALLGVGAFAAARGNRGASSSAPSNPPRAPEASAGEAAASPGAASANPAASAPVVPPTASAARSNPAPTGTPATTAAAPTPELRRTTTAKGGAPRPRPTSTTRAAEGQPPPKPAPVDKQPVDLESPLPR